MKIKLYKPYSGIIEEKMTFVEVSVVGKIGEHIQLIFKKENLDNPENVAISINEFYCEKDNTYYKVFKKIKLNYRFKFYHIHEYDDSFLAGTEWYVYLNFYKRIKIEWLFKRNWFQQNKNIKWILAIIITCAFTFFLNYFQII